MARKRDRYRFKDGKSRFNDVPLDGIVLMHVKGDLYKAEDPKVIRRLGLPKSATEFRFSALHRGMFLDGPLTDA